jgi:hypothetical protein
MKALNLWEDNPKVKPTNIETLSYQLAVCCRKSLRKTWDRKTLRSKDGLVFYPPHNLTVVESRLRKETRRGRTPRSPGREKWPSRPHRSKQ